jgi:hypothetical protein
MVQDSFSYQNPVQNQSLDMAYITVQALTKTHDQFEPA